MAFGKSREHRFRQLARRIEALRLKDEVTLQFRQSVMEARKQGVCRLWQICQHFAESLNSYMENDRIELTPPDPPEEFGEDEPIQLMINVRGRVLLLDLSSPTSLVASENFKKPYILEGDIRFFNQELLENERVEEHGIFFCPNEGPKGAWIYWNGRSYKSGTVDEDYFASLLEQII